MTENEIRKVIVIDAPPDVVFEAISDPEELTSWFPDAAILEPKVGGKFQFIFNKDSDRRNKRNDRGASPEGRVLEFIPNSKLAYSWQHKDIADFPETVVTWELEQLGKNKTRVTLTHSGFTGKEGDKGIREHNEGWDYFTARLVKYCDEKMMEQKTRKQDLSTKARSFTIEQSYYFKAPPKKVFQAMTDPKILVKWFLSKAKVVPRKGGTYSFDWIGGYHMTGSVKQFETNKAVSYSWHDEMPDGEMVETTASFQVAKKGRGTLLKLRHSGFTDPEHFAECSSRWAYYLTNMKSVLDWGTDVRSKYDW
ncbi:MAG TPA: SRPBCC domain-containing protein [Nitrososphaera sp.]